MMQKTAISQKSRIASISIKLIENSKLDIYTVNPESLLIENVSEGLISSTGYSRNELENMRIDFLNNEHNHQFFRKTFSPLKLGKKKSLVLNTYRRKKNGSIFSVTGKIYYVSTDSKKRFLILVHENKNVNNRDNFLANEILAATSEAIIITDDLFTIKQANKAFSLTTKFQIEDVRGKNINSICSSINGNHSKKNILQQLQLVGEWEGETNNKLANGEIFPAWVRIHKYLEKDGSVAGYIFAFNDISDKKNTLDKLSYLSNCDPLTGLPNRNKFIEAIKNRISKVEDDQPDFAILHIDINDFKKINKVFGHEAGNQIIISAAKRLSQKARKNDILASFGADEFCFLVDEVKSKQHAYLIVERLQKAFNAPFHFNDQEAHINVSIGIVLNKTNKTNVEELLQRAEHAVNYAKGIGKNSFHLYKNHQDKLFLSRFAMENQLHHAIENNELELYYQPQLDIKTGKILSAEALLRWNSPSKGLISPIDFIPIIEENELIIPIGNWIIKEACYQAMQWQNLEPEGFKIAINLSPVQFKNLDIIETVKEILKKTNLDPKMLELEITENHMMQESSITTEILHKFDNMGIGLQIDDFGTGYSSLSYLKKLPVNTLKIDQSFIKNIAHNSDDMAIVEAIIAMSHALNINVIAEGIEDKHQFLQLYRAGCNKIQGYLFGKPMKASEFTEYLAQHSQVNHQNLAYII